MAQQPVCGYCLKNMTCIKNDYQIECGHGYVKNGDKYRCVECGNVVIVGFGDLWRPSNKGVPSMPCAER